MSKAITRLEDLQPDPHNANRGTERGRAQLDTSFRAYGAGRSILADKDGVIIAGNKTLETAADLGLPIRAVHTTGGELIVVVRDDLSLATDPAARELAYADNRVAEADLDWDPAVLAEDLEAGVDLSAFWADDELLAVIAQAMSEPEPEPGAGGDEFDATPGDGATRVQPGDLWALGPHRLLCGDSTDPATVARLMDGTDALLLTDPPYGIGLNSAWQNALHDKHGKARNHSTAPIANDNGEINVDLFVTWPRRVVFGFPYLYDPTATGWLVWDKEPGFTGHSLTSPVEMAYSTTWQGFRAIRLLWSGYMRAAGSEAKEGHPTQKPIQVLADVIAQHPDPVIADLFMGSGTTLIAAHRTGRVAYGLEIEPRYCDVILRRAAAEGIGPIERIAHA